MSAKKLTMSAKIICTYNVSINVLAATANYLSRA